MCKDDYALWAESSRDFQFGEDAKSDVELKLALFALFETIR